MQHPRRFLALALLMPALVWAFASRHREEQPSTTGNETTKPVISPQTPALSSPRPLRDETPPSASSSLSPPATRPLPAVDPNRSRSDHEQLEWTAEVSNLSPDLLEDLHRRTGVLDDVAPLRSMFAEERQAAVVRQYVESLRKALPPP